MNVLNLPYLTGSLKFNYFSCPQKTRITGTSLAVQGLRLHASNAEGMGLIPGQGTKIPHALRQGQNKQKNTRITIIYI